MYWAKQVMRIYKGIWDFRFISVFTNMPDWGRIKGHCVLAWLFLWNMNHKPWLVLHFHIKSTWSRRPLNALISWCGLSLEWLLSSFLRSLYFLRCICLFSVVVFVCLVSVGQAISISALSIVQASCARLICLLNAMTASFISNNISLGRQRFRETQLLGPNGGMWRVGDTGKTNSWILSLSSL